MNRLIERVVTLARAKRPEVYRRYLLGLSPASLAALAADLEKDERLPARLPSRYYQIMGAGRPRGI